MFHRPVLAAWLLGALAASAQSIVPGFDVARVAVSQAGGMDLGNGQGDLEITQLSIRSFLCRPISPTDGLFIVPLASYELTHLNLDPSPAAFPFHDEDLHSLTLSGAAISMREGSPWIHGGWARAELATDFQTVTGDDFTFDLAGGAAYRLNARFTLGVGAALLNLNGDTSFYPGIGFDWIASDQLRIGLYGPTLLAAYAVNDDWLFTLRGDTAGGIWNITDGAGTSRSIDLTSYRAGLYASRRLHGELWLTAGAGATVGNQLDYTTPHGSKLSGLDPDTGVFGVIGLRLKAW